MKKWLQKQLKKKARVYIIPTRMGGYLNGLIFLMFLLSVGYSNNLLLIFTLLLFGMNLIWVIQTHFHLHALRLEHIQFKDGHAAEDNLLTIHWKKTPDGPHRWDMELISHEMNLPIRSIENSPTKSIGQININKRGVWDFQFLKIKTEMPFGLYQTWIYFPILSRVWIYPAKLKEMPALEIKPSTDEGDYSSLRKGPHDVWNLGPYQGEESRKISWKHYARTGDLVVKEGEELSNTIVHFELASASQDREYTLSRIATQMVFCSKNEMAFSFSTSDKRFKPQINEKHLNDCLRELAKC